MLQRCGFDIGSVHGWCQHSERGGLRGSLLGMRWQVDRCGHVVVEAKIERQGPHGSGQLREVATMAAREVAWWWPWKLKRRQHGEAPTSSVGNDSAGHNDPDDVRRGKHGSGERAWAAEHTSVVVL